MASTFDLITACRKNSITGLQEFIEVNPKTDLSAIMIPDHGYGPSTPLMIAIRYKSFRIIKYLIEICQINTETLIPNEYYPNNTLTAAILCTDLKIAKYLYKHSVNLSAKDVYGNSLLFYFLINPSSRHTSARKYIKWLLERGITVPCCEMRIKSNIIVNKSIDFPFHTNAEVIEEHSEKCNEILKYTYVKPKYNVFANYSAYKTLREVWHYLPLPLELIIKIINELFA